MSHSIRHNSNHYIFFLFNIKTNKHFFKECINFQNDFKSSSYWGKTINKKYVALTFFVKQETSFFVVEFTVNQKNPTYEYEVSIFLFLNKFKCRTAKNAQDFAWPKVINYHLKTFWYFGCKFVDLLNVITVKTRLLSLVHFASFILNCLLKKYYIGI